MINRRVRIEGESKAGEMMSDNAKEQAATLLKDSESFVLISIGKKDTTVLSVVSGANIPHAVMACMEWMSTLQKSLNERDGE